MNEAMLAFLELVKVVSPYDIAWRFGMKAYRYVLDALSGRNAQI